MDPTGLRGHNGEVPSCAVLILEILAQDPPEQKSHIVTMLGSVCHWFSELYVSLQCVNTFIIIILIGVPMGYFLLPCSVYFKV